MASAAELQLLYKTANAPVLPFPFPHFFVQDVFPAGFYDQLQQNLPDPSALIPIEQARPVRGYKERFVLELKGQYLDRIPENKRVFWQDLSRWLVGGSFMQSMLAKFAPQVEQRFRSTPGAEFEDEAMLVRSEERRVGKECRL